LLLRFPGTLADKDWRWTPHGRRARCWPPICLVLMSVSTGPLTFAVSLALTEVVSAAVLYATAFTAIVQAGGKKAQSFDRPPHADRRVRVVDVLAPDVLDARFPVVA
jgi:hypothetical protein